MSEIKKLRFFAGGKWHASQTGKYMNIYDPSTGAAIAQTPCCTEDEVKFAIKSATEAFPPWSDTPAPKRAQVLFKFRELLEKNLDELTHIVCRENGKAHWFGEHPKGFNSNTKYETYIDKFKTIKPVEYGIEIINCSRRTALDMFPVWELSDALC